MTMTIFDEEKIINAIDKAFNSFAKREQIINKMGDTDYHVYTNADNDIVCIKSRVYYTDKQGKKSKFMRFFSVNDKGNFVMNKGKVENNYPQGKGKLPIYLLPSISQTNNDDIIYIFEGEQKADLAVKLGFIATTTGGATSVKHHDLQPLTGKKVVLWCDNDTAGLEWLKTMITELSKLDCNIKVIDVDKLGLNDKGDIVDWYDGLMASGEYEESDLIPIIKNLPIVENKEILGINTDKLCLSDSIADNKPSNKPQGEVLEPTLPYENGQFELYKNGLFFVTYDDENNIAKASFICSCLFVKARCTDKNSGSWGIVLEWQDRANVSHVWSMANHYLQGDGREYRKELVDKGLVISTHSKAQKYLASYLNNHPITTIGLCVDKTGWHDGAYVLPQQVYGNSEELIIYQPPKIVENAYRQKGTLEQWQQQVSIPMAEQSRIAFAMCCSFAGQLLEPLGLESGGFHYVGRSSIGKSVSMSVASSIWGNYKDYMKRWNTTKNGIENLASDYNDGFLPLDEISEIDPKDVGKAVYMLGNGQGKSRSTTSGINRPTKTWRLIFLSSGEESLDSFMQQAGVKANAGLFVRLCHIQADVANGYGVFDSLVIADSAEKQAVEISNRALQYYGVAGIAWLEYLTTNLQQVTKQAKAMIKQFMNDYSELKGQAHRIAQRFALVAVAGELATQANITGWQSGNATNAVKSCLDNWIDNNGTDGNREEQQIIDHLQSVFNGTRWQFQDLKNYDIQPMAKRLGYYDDDNFYIFKSLMKSVCGNFNSDSILTVLDSKELLIKNHGNRKAYRMRNQFFYAIDKKILEL